MTDLFGSVFGGGDQQDPLAPNIGTSIPSFVRKWSTLPAELDQAGVDPGVYKQIAQIDLDRARKGQMPLSAKDTAMAIQAARSGQPVIPKPDSKGLGGLVTHSFDDLRTLLSSIPKLPGTLVSEAAHLSDIGPGMQEAMQQHGLKNQLGAMLGLPGIRMVPGTFVARSLLTEPHQLVEHPLFSLLDVLPAAERLVPESAVAHQAEIAAEADRVKPGPLRSAYREYVKAPMEEALTQRGLPTPEDVRNRLGFGPGPQFVARASAQATRALHAQLASEIQDIIQKRKDLGISDERLGEVSRIGEMGKPEELATLAPNEQQYLDYVDQVNERWAQRGVTSKDIYEAGGEYYPKAQGKPMANLQAKLESKANTTGLEDQEAKVLTVLGDLERRQRSVPSVDTGMVGSLKESLQRRIAAPFASEIATARSVGMEDAANLYERIGRTIYQNTRAPIVRAAQLLDHEVGPDGLMDTLKLRNASKAMNRAAIRLNEVATNTGDLVMRREADWMRGQADWLDDQASVHADVKGIPRKERDLNSLLDTISTRKENIEAITADLEARMAQTVPARFHPLIQERYQTALRTLAESKNPGLVGDALHEMYANLDAGLYELVPNLTVRDLSKTYREAAATWTELRDAGYNPRYMHHVDPSQIRTIERPTVYPEAVRSPTQVRARTRDMKAYFQNYEIAMSHQAMEWLRRDMTEKVVDQLATRFGKTRAALIEEYRPIAEKMMAAGHALPGQDLRATIDLLLKRDGWQEWNPKEIVTWNRAQAGVGASGDLMMPSWARDTIQKMYPSVSGMRGILDKTTSAFRMSILPLSPRWHLYNVLGGYIMLSMKTDPFAVLRYFSRAREMMKGEMPVEIAKGVGQTVSAEEWAYSHAVGQQLGKWWQQGAETPVGKIGAGFKKVINKSFDLNELVDNFYRSVAYLYGEDKTLLKGMSEKEAKLAGVELANKVLQDWDAMTPFERQTLRAIFPFYGWMKHILTFTMGYPIDHPLRASILANFARNEYDDFSKGLPDKFFGMFYFGKPDENGKVKAVNFRGSNPFSDVANYSTLAGFAGQLNPVIGGVLQSMGINMASGKQDLYPNLTYDRQTGRLVAKNINPAESILFSVLPQTEWLAGQVGLTPDDMRALKINNPDAYNQRLRSILGLPPMPTEVNLYREAALAELSRDKAAQNALSQALKTGNWQDAMRYPSVRPLLQLVKTMPQLQQQWAIPPRMQQAG